MDIKNIMTNRFTNEINYIYCRCETLGKSFDTEPIVIFHEIEKLVKETTMDYIQALDYVETKYIAEKFCDFIK